MLCVSFLSRIVYSKTKAIHGLLAYIPSSTQLDNPADSFKTVADVRLGQTTIHYTQNADYMAPPNAESQSEWAEWCVCVCCPPPKPPPSLFFPLVLLVASKLHYRNEWRVLYTEPLCTAVTLFCIAPACRQDGSQEGYPGADHELGTFCPSARCAGVGTGGPEPQRSSPREHVERDLWPQYRNLLRPLGKQAEVWALLF